ncbi:MAG: FAD:protein FMN transferase [Roseburia sp.]|nr:FAD:protein FMN transferase [Roseburia sp.]MCM1243665.1 FAD:protein FMN transferase [Roseburia sp.]
MDTNRGKKYFIKIAGLLMSALFLSGCAGRKEPVSQSGFYFDTVIQVTIYDAAQKDCLDGCMELAKKYEKILSPTVEGSDVWNINHSGGAPVTVSEETVTLLKTALSYCEMTEGKIDITIEPVNRLWDFHADNPVSDNPGSSNVSDISGTTRIPDEKELAEAVSHVDYHNLIIDGDTVTLRDPESAVSLGFIAKGYIADKMKEYLVSQNITSAIINLGGNLLAVGSRPDGSPFQFGIQKPFDEHGSVIAVLPVTDISAVSSGVYERYFYEDDVLYHHILDSNDGYPVQNGLFGVTILSESSLMGDALSTTCFVLGLDEGMALVESLEDVEAVFITQDYEVVYSSGIGGE